MFGQIVFLSVRIYFLLCLVSRQFITREGAAHRSEVIKGIARSQNVLTD